MSLVKVVLICVHGFDLVVCACRCKTVDTGIKQVLAQVLAGVLLLLSATRSLTSPTLAAVAPVALGKKNVYIYIYSIVLTGARAYARGRGFQV